MLRSLPGYLPPVRRILDLAPHAQIRRVLESAFPHASYTGTDLLEPDREIDVLADITELPIRTDAVDLLICYHVLEHVPDDGAAMREIARVLAPAGLGLLQVPYRPTAVTDEDPSLPPAQRAERFGQEDHVRWYGGDFDDRLTGAGLDVHRARPPELTDESTIRATGASPSEPIWFVRPSGGPGPPASWPLSLTPVSDWSPAPLRPPAPAKTPGVWDRVRSVLAPD